MRRMRDLGIKTPPINTTMISDFDNHGFHQTADCTPALTQVNKTSSFSQSAEITYSNHRK